MLVTAVLIALVTNAATGELLKERIAAPYEVAQECLDFVASLGPSKPAKDGTLTQYNCVVRLEKMPPPTRYDQGM